MWPPGQRGCVDAPSVQVAGSVTHKFFSPKRNKQSKASHNEDLNSLNSLNSHQPTGSVPVHTTDDPPHAQRGRLTHLCVGHYTVTDTGHTTGLTA